MTALNWVLGIVTVVSWGGVLVWYFKDEIRTYWRFRNDRWFRGD